MTRSVNARFVSDYPVFYDATTGEHSLPVAPLVYYDDFVGAGDLVVPAAGSAESGVDWVKKIVGSAPPTVAGTANATNGVIALSMDSTSEKQEAVLYHGDQKGFSVTQNLVAEFRFNVGTLPTLNGIAVIGVASDWADGPDAVTYSAWFKIKPTGTVWAETDDNATDNSAQTSITLGTSDWAIGRIDMTDPANIRFFINGVEITPSGTTYAFAATGANAKVQPYAGVYKASGAGLGVMSVDFFRLYQQRS